MVSLTELKDRAKLQKDVFNTLSKLRSDSLNTLDYFLVLSIADLADVDRFCFASELKEHEFPTWYSRPTIQ